MKKHILDFLAAIREWCDRSINTIDLYEEYSKAKDKIGCYYRYEDKHDGGGVDFSHVILCHISGVRREVKTEYDDGNYEDRKIQTIYQKGEYFSYFEQAGIRYRCDELGADERALMHGHYGFVHDSVKITSKEWNEELVKFKNYPSVDEKRRRGYDKFT